MPKKSTFKIFKMDCPSEENLIRMKLSSFADISLVFDTPQRTLTVYHHQPIDPVALALSDLNLNSQLIHTEETNEQVSAASQERKLLAWVLAINFLLFVVEIITGLIANSMGLVADSLDMLADALIYGLSLYAVGKAVSQKKRVAKLSGYFQITLALFGIVEVIRRFVGYEDVPAFKTMIGISLLALIGNALSMYILQKTKSKEAHIQASKIFTSNDILVNIGVIAAGTAVYFTHSKLPDLVIGAFVFVLVLRGAFRILKL